MPQYSLAEFDHPDTPEHLSQLNAQIVELLNLEEIDSEQLLALVDKRDEIINQYLKTLNEQSSEQKSFIEQEIQANNKLTRICQSLFSATEKALVNLKKGQKAIKHYK